MFPCQKAFLFLFFLTHVIELKLISRFHFVGLERRRDKEYEPKMSVKMPGKARGKKSFRSQQIFKGLDDPSQLNLGLFPELAVHHARMREVLRARGLSGRHSAAN